MDVRVVAHALEQVVAELAATEQEFEILRLKRERLETAQSSLSALLDSEPPSPEIAAPVSEPVPLFEPKATGRLVLPPVWVHVRNLFRNEHGGKLTVPQIHQRLTAHGISIDNPDAIRIAMRRKPELFNNDGFGRFSLIEKEADSEEKTS